MNDNVLSLVPAVGVSKLRRVSIKIVAAPHAIPAALEAVQNLMDADDIRIALTVLPS